jgi:hypothetical protein
MLTATRITKPAPDLVPYGEVVRELENWSRWAATWKPALGVQPPPWAEYFRPKYHRDAEWGEWEEPVDAKPPKTCERSAERVDRLVMRLATCHILVLKHRYIDTPRKYETRERIDAAIRALGDILA